MMKLLYIKREALAQTHEIRMSDKYDWKRIVPREVIIESKYTPQGGSVFSSVLITLRISSSPTENVVFPSGVGSLPCRGAGSKGGTSLGETLPATPAILHS